MRAQMVNIWEYRHALIREVLYLELLPPVRRQIHRQVGEILSQRANPIRIWSPITFSAVTIRERLTG